MGDGTMTVLETAVEEDGVMPHFFWIASSCRCACSKTAVCSFTKRHYPFGNNMQAQTNRVSVHAFLQKNRQILTGSVPYAMLLSEVSKLKGRYKIPLPNKGADPKRWDYDLKGAGGTQKVERQLAYIK